MMVLAAAFWPQMIVFGETACPQMIVLGAVACPQMIVWPQIIVWPQMMVCPQIMVCAVTVADPVDGEGPATVGAPVPGRLGPALTRAAAESAFILPAPLTSIPVPGMNELVTCSTVFTSDGASRGISSISSATVPLTT